LNSQLKINKLRGNNQVNNHSERPSPLTAEQINEYENNGYLIIRQGCSDDLTEAYNSHIYTLRVNQDVEEEGQFSKRMFNPHNDDSFSLQMMKLPIVRGAVEQILGKEAAGIQSMYFFKAPRTKGQAAHQDYEYIKNEPNTMTAVWLAMDKTDEANGCLWVLPGSHKLGLLKHG
jgi:phytanoyl-CoA hydroxylase